MPSSPAQIASAELLGYAYTMAEEAPRTPKDDIVTAAGPGRHRAGSRLEEIEFGYFVVLLAVAGNETTRNAISHGMNAFIDNPDQWELYKRERPATTADEIVRWATPVTASSAPPPRSGSRRVEIKKGQRVGMFYGSANFDEDVFENPFEFNILRDPNPHVGFGGHGAHYCVGANLARMEINLIFNAIADHMPDITKIAEPRRLRSGWINGVKHWQVDYTGKCPVAQ